MEAELLAKCTQATLADAQKYVDWLNEVMDFRQISTPTRQAAFLATLAVESINLSKAEESLYYRDAARLASLYKRAFSSAADAASYTRNPEALGKLLYDGYWGRGLIQLTWERNYAAAGKALGMDFLLQPELVAEPEWAAKTAGWYWDENNCNAPADEGDMRGVTLRVNGPKLMHLDRRTAIYNDNMGFLT